MSVSDDIQHIIIEIDVLDKLMELLWLGYQQPVVRMEHAISSMCLLRKQVGEVEEHLRKVLEAVEKGEMRDTFKEKKQVIV